MTNSQAFAFCCIIFLGLFAFIGIEKYGIVVAFIKISGIFYILSSFAATYWISRFIHSYFKSRYHLEPWRTVSGGPYELSRIIVFLFIFIALLWAIERSGDSVLIAATNLSKNVLWPCTTDTVIFVTEEGTDLWRLKERAGGVTLVTEEVANLWRLKEPLDGVTLVTEEETMEARNLWRLKEHEQFECGDRATSKH